MRGVVFRTRHGFGSLLVKMSVLLILTLSFYSISAVNNKAFANNNDAVCVEISWIAANAQVDGKSIGKGAIRKTIVQELSRITKACNAGHDPCPIVDRKFRVTRTVSEYLVSDKKFLFEKRRMLFTHLKDRCKSHSEPGLAENSQPSNPKPPDELATVCEILLERARREAEELVKSNKNPSAEEIEKLFKPAKKVCESQRKAYETNALIWGTYLKIIVAQNHQDICERKREILRTQSGIWQVDGPPLRQKRRVLRIIKVRYGDFTSPEAQEAERNGTSEGDYVCNIKAATEEFTKLCDPVTVTDLSRVTWHYCKIPKTEAIDKTLCGKEWIPKRTDNQLRIEWGCGLKDDPTDIQEKIVEEGPDIKKPFEMACIRDPVIPHPDTPPPAAIAQIINFLAAEPCAVKIAPDSKKAGKKGNLKYGVIEY